MLSGIPLPRVVADTGPGGNIVTSMQGANALTKSNLENQYFVPQMLSGVLSNPTLTANLPASTTNALAQLYGNALGGGGGLRTSQPFGRQALSYLWNKLTGGATPSGNAITQTPTPDISTGSQTVSQDSSSNSDTAPNAEEAARRAGFKPSDPAYSVFVRDWNAKYGNQQSGDGSQNIPSTAYPSGGAPSSTAGNIDEQVKVPGSQGGVNAASAAQAQAQGLSTTATTEASAQQNTWSDIQNNDTNVVKDAQASLFNIDKARIASDKLNILEQGPGLGALPGVSDAAQAYDGYISSLVNQVTNQNVQGHVTDQARDFFLDQKPTRSKNKNVRDDMLNFGQGMNQRLLELPAFDNAAKAANLTPIQRAAVWTYYNNKNPFYYQDKDGRVYVNSKNLGKWNQYLSSANVKKALQGYTPKAPSGPGITEPAPSTPKYPVNPSARPGTVTLRNPKTGQVITISVEEARKGGVKGV